MWVNTKVVIDMETLAVVECEGFDYDGLVVECKGGGKGGKGGGGDPYAAQRKAENQRKQQASETIGTMEKTFSDTFTPDYWGDYESQLRDFYTPQIEEQYGSAATKLRNTLGGAQGSAQRQAINDLKRAYSQSQDTVEAQIARQIAEEQSRISGKKTDLTSTINLSSDPANAVGDVGSLVSGLALPAAPSSIDTGLGDLVNSWITGKLATQIGGGIGGGGGFNINPYSRSSAGGTKIVR